jgi:hypothetical protein
MEELTAEDKCKLIYENNDKIGALLFYHTDKKNQPFSKISYWEYDKDFKKMTLYFDSQVYGKDKIEQYWKEILELDKNKKLNMNTLSDAIDNFLFKDFNPFKE